LGGVFFALEIVMRICTNVTELFHKGYRLFIVNLRNRIISSYIFLAILCAAGCSSDLWAQEMTLKLDPANSKVEFRLPDVLHTVHGTFAMKSGLIHFNPSNGSASGSVLVDVKSGQSGNSTRDRKMHKEILQSEQYPDATFMPTKMSGAFSPQGSSEIQVDGTFRIHGSDHPITLVIPLQISGSSANFKTQLVLPYVQWGMKNPSTFVLRVSDRVDLAITASGRIAQDPQSADARIR
jgi:polyisoprenoid-binding protein YceI